VCEHRARDWSTPQSNVIRDWWNVLKSESAPHCGRERSVADSLFLSLWFSSFELDEMLLQTLAVMRQFSFSAQQSGISYVALHPVSWNEPTIFEQRCRPGITPEEAVLLASDLLHEDYAYLFEAFWDLWILADDRRQWSLQPSRVKFLVHGIEFDNGAYQQDGHVQVDFGIDSPFLQDEVQLTSKAETRVRANVQKLVEFTNKAEKGSGASGRLLWSESEENFAQKLIARLQKVQ
jgi:hypothetical protein